MDVLHTRPAAEHEGVVGGEDGDHVDALLLELVVLLRVGREVVGVARGLARRVSALSRGGARKYTYRERSRDGEDDDLLALEGVGGQLRGYARVGSVCAAARPRGRRTGTARGVRFELGRVVDGGELASGDDVADLDVDHSCYVCFGEVVGEERMSGRADALKPSRRAP